MKWRLIGKCVGQGDGGEKPGKHISPFLENAKRHPLLNISQTDEVFSALSSALCEEIRVLRMNLSHF
jgi:hypothetical protein